MKKTRILILLLVFALALSACGLIRGPQAEVPTSTPSPTMTRTSVPTATFEQPGGATTTPVPGAATAIPTTAQGATAIPTTAPTSVPATRPAATSAPRATATWAGMREVNIYMIALEDNGASGPKIGCNDSVIAVKRVLDQPTQSPLRTALNLVLAQKDQYYGESGLYNPMYQQNLTLDDVTIRNGLAIVQLSGTLVLVGTCEDPRLKAQLEYTALQFTTVDAVQITVNGTPLDDLMSTK